MVDFSSEKYSGSGGHRNSSLNTSRKGYDSPLPPKMFLENNKIFSKHEDFISATISERIANGSMPIWGKVGDCEPPQQPITIKPSKPRICHDERFLNLWIDAPHVSFDKITDIPRYVAPSHYQSKLDDKSGYDHILLTEDSRKFFGLCWMGWFLVYNMLPFSWSPSAYVYHTTGLGAKDFIRSNGVPASLYIDDHHVGQLRLPQGCLSDWSDLDSAKAVSFIAAIVLAACGYFIGLKKPILPPQQVIPFLDFLSDSQKQAFTLHEDKK